MNRKEAAKIVRDSSLSEGPKSRARRLALLSKADRRSIIVSGAENEDVRTAAAIEIQRLWRGHRGRCMLFGSVNQKASKTAMYGGSLHHFTRVDDDFNEGEDPSQPPSTEKVRRHYENYLRELELSGASSAEVPKFNDYCAGFIQDWWKDRRQLQNQPKEPPSMPKPPPPKRRIPPSERQAASIIQRAWRRHIDIQVYRYYRDLINFKTRGNPSMMLRCINPTEAKLLDAAAGVHIKFRLAGERFPPNIYYKIFTHRPIQDLCANSPKDYTKPQTKIRMAKDQHNKFRPVPDQNTTNKSDWYQRTENNGWRLVSDRLIQHIMADPVTWETSHKKYEFNHDKLQRRQDVEKRKKQKKIDWMKKMYRQGMLKAKSDDPETVNLIEGAAAGMVATVDKMGTDALEDWEVDELLDWTTSLNFEDYMNNWREVATSAFSERHVDERIRLYTGNVDPYEFSISTGQSRYQSTQPSRNTPASSVSGQIPVNS